MFQRSLVRENVTSLFLSLKRIICNFPDDIKALGEIARNSSHRRRSLERTDSPTTTNDGDDDRDTKYKPEKGERRAQRYFSSRRVF